ncbi:MAG: Uma2 family endonuclease [Chloracidobacterium sp.]|nr:Uma2 family endonuclease [Chloracidobacterium sp.]MDW8216135.1 Uma2 family endonuclease [Acidobacteriota bacterium]
MTPQLESTAVASAAITDEAEVTEDLALDLPDEDGVPLESVWHRLQINLLDDCLRQHWRGRRDFLAGGNMFVYYSLEQARRRNSKGLDFFVVKGVDGTLARRSWVVWREGGRLPDVIVELLSPSTQGEDLGAKKVLYERVFRAAEYYCYGPDPSWGMAAELVGRGLVRGRYEALERDGRGWLWSEQLEVWLGEWEGEYHGVASRWLRLYDPTGRLVPTAAEAAEAEAARAQAEAEAARRRAEEERARAEAAEARSAALETEVRRLKAALESRDTE